MIVHGFVVTPDVQRSLIARMMDRPFTAADIELEGLKNGVPGVLGGHYVLNRVCDRVLQQQRKAGNIAREGRGWRWVG